MGRHSELRIRSRTASLSEPSARSTPSERSIRSHRIGQTGDQLENGPADLKEEHEKFERMRAEAAAAGKRVFCPACRSSSIRYLKDGSFLCVGRSTSRGKPCCEAQGFTTVFTAKEAREAGRYWLSDLKSAPE